MLDLDRPRTELARLESGEEERPPGAFRVAFEHKKPFYTGWRSAGKPSAAISHTRPMAASVACVARVRYRSLSTVVFHDD